MDETTTQPFLEAMKDDLRFMSNAGKDDREQWILESWCSLSGRDSTSFKKGEGPDYSSASEAVEITEVLLPERRRGDEFRQAVQAVEMGKLPNPNDAGELQSVLTNAHEWIARAVSRKASHYGDQARSWILVVYANYSFWERTQWVLTRRRIATVSTFKEIHVLTAGGEHVERPKP